MKKTKLTRSLLAACSIVALTAVIYGCEGGHSDAEVADAETAAAAQAKADAEAKAKAEADAAAKRAADAAAAAKAEADAAAKRAADAAAAAKAEADAAAKKAAEELKTARDAAARAATAATEAAEQARQIAEDAARAAEQAEADRQAAAEQAEKDKQAAAEAARKAAEEAAAAAAEKAEADRLAAIEAAKHAIGFAATAEDAQADMDAVIHLATAAEAAELQAAVDARQMMLAEMAAAAERQMLVDAAMCMDATPACVAAHDALIAALQADVDALAEDEDATNAQQTAAQMALDEATATRNRLQMQVTEIDRSTATGSAVGAAVDAANGLETARSADDIANAEALLATAKGMLTEADEYDDQIAMAEMAIARAKERNMVDAAVMAATGAASGLTEASDAAAVTAAQGLIDAAKMAVMDAEHLSDAEKAAHNATITSDERLVTLAKNRNDAAAEEKRLAEEKAAEEEARKKNEAMAATAAKLYAGIAAPSGEANSPAATDRAAAYNNAGTPTGAAVDTHILVSIGDGTNVPTAIVLSEDMDAMIADNHGWEGKRYVDPAGGDMVEAIVYSNVEAPTMGRKFGSTAAVTPTGAYEYQVTAGGALTGVTLDATAAARVALTSVTRTAGTETFNLPDPNPNNEQFITVPGSFHGVSGTYSCDTGAGRTDACTAAVAAEGFTLTGAWTFTPSNAEARVMDSEDTAYASYGWWIHKAANDGPFTASAFVDVKGTVTPASGLDALNGTATYMGGAAGKYALSSSTGGTNDAGHFTARATLEADFTNNTDAAAITGTLDMFMGADGEARDWEVSLKGSAITDAGVIGNDGTSTTSPGGTVWTIGDDAADAAGSWAGSLLNQPAAADGGDGVPTVATGTFYSTYDQAGKMVGAFGANKQ